MVGSDQRECWHVKGRTFGYSTLVFQSWWPRTESEEPTQRSTWRLSCSTNTVFQGSDPLWILKQFNKITVYEEKDKYHTWTCELERVGLGGSPDSPGGDESPKRARGGANVENIIVVDPVEPQPGGVLQQPQQLPEEPYQPPQPVATQLAGGTVEDPVAAGRLLW